MAKRLKKSEKLDLILSELAKLRGEVKKLVGDRAAVKDARPKPSSAPRSNKLPKPTSAGEKPDKDVVPSKPVSVETPRVAQAISRTSTPFQSAGKPR
jgi:hypothetical protein